MLQIEYKNDQKGHKSNWHYVQSTHFFYFNSTQVFITLNSFKSVDLRRWVIVLGGTPSRLYAVGSVVCNYNPL